MNDEQRNEPLTKLGESAAQLHEAYWSLVHVGFTEPQALYLTGCLACNQAAPHRKDPTMAEEPATSTVRSALAIDRACDEIMQSHPDPSLVAAQLREILVAVRDLRSHQVDDVLAHIGAIGQRYGGQRSAAARQPDDPADELATVDGDDDGQTSRARARADELAERVRAE